MHKYGSIVKNSFFLYSGRRLHIMIKKQVEFHKIWFSGNMDTAYRKLCLSLAILRMTGVTLITCMN